MRAFTQAPSLHLSRVHRDLALLLLTAVACGLPFLGQAFHMDDGFYMDMARNARVKPLYPNDTPYVFEGQFLSDMGSHSHPPWQSYFLAALQAVAGESDGAERTYHACALVYPVLAVFAFYFLAARFVERPLWPALLLAAAPVFQVMSHNLMTDVPALAFWLATTAAFVWGVDLRRRFLLAASAVFGSAAMFTSYTSVALLPLLGFYQIRRRGPRHAWPALLAPAVLLMAWLGVNCLHYGRFILLDTLGYVQARHAALWTTLGTKAVALLQYQGWLVVFPAFFLMHHARGMRGRAAALATMAAIYAAQTVVPSYRMVDKLIFVVGAVAGAFVVMHMGVLLLRTFKAWFVPAVDSNAPPRPAETSASGDRAAAPPAISVDDPGFDDLDAQFLGLWYFGIVAVCLLLYTEGSARYILPLVPPLLLCYCRSLEVAETSEYRRLGNSRLRASMVMSGSLVCSLAWGLALSRADWEFAATYPRAAGDVRRAAGGLPCYGGGEWGFRYYLRRAGVQQLPRDETEVWGASLVVLPKLALPYPLPAALASMTSRQGALSYQPDTMLRILDLETPAGFYSTGWGLVPFSFSGRPLETVEIYQVDFLLERLPWTRIQIGAGPIRPWVGYVEIDGGRHLALMVRSGGQISYPWTLGTAARFEVRCGFVPEAVESRGEVRGDFALCLRDAAGGIVSRSEVTVRRDEGEQWRRLEINLQPAPAEGLTLELRYSGAAGSSPVGAFAAASIKPLEQ